MNLGSVEVILVVVHVDYVVLFSKYMTQMTRHEELLSSKFDWKDVGDIAQCLGLQIYRNRNRRTNHLGRTHKV